MNQQSIEQSIDYILKYNLQYLPKKKLYQYLQHIALATKKTDAASAYQNAIDELSPENAATHAAPQKAENEVLAAVDAVLKEYPDSRWESASAWLHTLKGKRYPGGNGGRAIAMRCVVSTGNVELLKFVLNENYNKEYIIHNDKTALMFAAQKGYLDCVKELIKAKANVNTKNKAGETAIWFAIGKPNMLKEIINAKADVNVKVIKNSWTPLMYNARNGHTECVKALIAGKADLNLQDKDGWSALRLAAQFGHTECVKALIAAGADINSKDKDGWTPLISASEAKQTECVKALIAGKADLNLQTKDGRSALLLAARNGHTECVKALIAGKADLNLKDKDGWSALLLAARDGHTECVKALIAAGADINAKDKDGWTPLILASEAKHTECVKALIAGKADLNFQTKDGWDFSALMFAARDGQTECVKALIAGKADLNLQKHDGMSALMLAALNGNTECVKALIAGKADLNLQAKDGKSALMLAARDGHTECVKVLIDAGADINAKYLFGSTALMEAAEKGHVAVVVALLQAGAYIYTTNKSGKTAETIARENKQTEVLKFLVAYREKLEAQARYWKNCFAMINYGIAGLFTAFVIMSIKEKSGMNGSDDDIALYVIGCLVPLFIKAWGASKAIGKPVDKKSSFIYGTSDFLCVMALCLPALSHNTVLGEEFPGFAIAAILVHITMGVLWYKKTVKQVAKANTLVIWNFATAAVLMYLAGGVITGSYSVFGNLFAALTLGYFN